MGLSFKCGLDGPHSYLLMKLAMHLLLSPYCVCYWTEIWGFSSKLFCEMLVVDELSSVAHTRLRLNKNAFSISCTSPVSISGMKIHNAVYLQPQLFTNVSIRLTSGNRKISDVSLHLGVVFNDC
jgi:hypothetical protein